MKKRFSKRLVQAEIQRRIASGESHQDIYEDMTMLYQNNQEIAKLIRNAFKAKTKIKDINIRIR